MTKHALLIDVSANGRVKLALIQGAMRPELAAIYACRTIGDFAGAIDDFLVGHTKADLIGAAVSACGWEHDGGLAMPNDTFRIQRSWLRAFLGVARVNIVNDCVCTAMSVDLLRPEETVKLCGEQGDPTQPKILIGASLGLGMALIVPDDLNGNTILPCEGGHTDLPATTDMEKAVLSVLERKFGRVSRERAASLQGLQEIWHALGILEATPAAHLPPREIIEKAREGHPLAKTTLELCAGWLAMTASDAALMTGARGGVYLAGELIDLIHEDLKQASFSTRFQHKGRLSPYVTEIPVHAIVARDPELIGLSTLFPEAHL